MYHVLLSILTAAQDVIHRSLQQHTIFLRQRHNLFWYKNAYHIDIIWFVKSAVACSLPLSETAPLAKAASSDICLAERA